MARGALVPDDIVVGIVAERIEQPDARKGFILDGFPRTVPQAEALDRMLAEQGLALDAVIELRVDEDALVRRIESRIAEMKARGEPVRDDDDPEVLHRRLAAYREQTAPLIAYYRQQGVLRTVDGMAPIAEVAAAIERDRRGAGGQAPPAARRPRRPRDETPQRSRRAPAKRRKPAAAAAAARKPMQAGKAAPQQAIRRAKDRKNRAANRQAGKSAHAQRAGKPAAGNDRTRNR